jgi:hypothetical protein
MSAALNEQDFLCCVFGECVSGHIVDREIGTMSYYSRLSLLN